MTGEGGGERGRPSEDLVCWRAMAHTEPSFVALLEADQVEQGDGETIAVRRERVGELVVRTGQIAAADPLMPSEVCTFTRRVEPGRYPVDLVIVTTPQGEDLCAAAVLRVGEGKVARWEEAEAESAEGYGVDSATGCFVDAAYFSEEGLVDEETFYNDFIEAMDRASVGEMVQRVVYPLKAEDGLNMVGFTTGFGDGMYRSWWGLDQEGRPVMLVTDFEVWEEEELGE